MLGCCTAYVLLSMGNTYMFCNKTDELLGSMCDIESHAIFEKRTWPQQQRMMVKESLSINKVGLYMQ